MSHAFWIKVWKTRVCSHLCSTSLSYKSTKQTKKRQQTNKNKHEFHSVLRRVSWEILRSLKKNVSRRKPLSALCSTKQSTSSKKTLLLDDSSFCFCLKRRRRNQKNIYWASVLLKKKQFSSAMTSCYFHATFFDLAK